jgi:hypothetical protein
MANTESYLKCLLEIDEIKIYAEKIKTCHLSTKLVIHKEEVSLECLKKLAVFLNVKLNPKSEAYQTNAYICLKDENCDIIISEN